MLNYTPLPIEFDKKKHAYMLDGIPMIGVSTVKNMKHKEFMPWWSVKEMYTFLLSNWKVVKKYTRAEKIELLAEAKGMWQVKGKEAMAIGTDTHDLIQQSINNDKRLDPNTIENKFVRNSYNAWLEWEKTHKVVYLKVEMIVGSRIHWIAGTLDILAMVDGVLTLLDWKTSSMLTNAEFLQTAPYVMMLYEGGITELIQRMIVRLDKKTGKFEEYKITSDYNKDIEAFLCLLKVYRWDRDVNKKFADHNGKLTK